MTIEIKRYVNVCSLHFDLGVMFYNCTVGLSHTELISSLCCANTIVFDHDPRDGGRSLPWFLTCSVCLMWCVCGPT